ANARFVVHDQHARPFDGARGTFGRRRRGRPFAARPLRVEPGIDVTFAEPPLTADPDRGNLARLDQAIDRAQIDLEILEHLLGREENFVAGKVDTHWSLYTTTCLDCGS